MVSRDYTKELGLKSPTPKVPWPVAAIVLAGCGVAVWFGVKELHQQDGPAKARVGSPAVQTAPAD
jgi:hypothetical protein